MAFQETIGNALSALSGGAAAIATALAAAVALWLVADFALEVLDVHVPVRQLVLGRNLQAVTVHWRLATCLTSARLARIAAFRGTKNAVHAGRARRHALA